MKITPSSAKIDPTERSMPPVMMTNPSPSENRPNRPIRLAVLARLSGDRKRGFKNATTAPTTRISRNRPRSFFNIVLISIQSLADGELQHIALAELVAFKEAGNLPLLHHRHAVGDADHLLHVARNHQHRDPAIGEVAHQLVDLALGADVDTARRL